MANYSYNTKELKMPDTSGLERQVLADLILNADLITTAAGIISRASFSHERFGRVWDTLNEFKTDGVSVDYSTIGARIDPGTLHDLLGTAPAGINETMDHCRALAEMATRRFIFAQAYEMMSRAGNPGADFSELLSMPGDLVSKLTVSTRAGAGTQTMSDVLNNTAGEIEANQMSISEGKRTRVPTGFSFLDRLTFGGFKGCNLIILAARPSVGKTAVMLQMAIAAGRAGFPGIVYSLEMSNTEIGQRLLYSTGAVTPGQLARNAVNWPDIERANGDLDELPLRFNDRCRTLDEICNDILLNHQRGGCEIAFIDHLHRISSDSRQSSYQVITERTGRFKSLAMDCRIPIVLLCQLNRMSETENRAPDLRDLRDSGSIEQDADIVLMLERATGARNDPNVNMWVRKNRQGEAGNICDHLRGGRAFTVFEEINDTHTARDAGEYWYNNF